jgi:hypothetical protein
LLLTFSSPAPAALQLEDGIAMVAEPRAGTAEQAPQVARPAAGRPFVAAPRGASQAFAATAVARVATPLYLLNCALLR